MEKSIKINIPEGHEINKEKSTLENIVFKKTDNVVIKWLETWKVVDIKAGRIHFLLHAEKPYYYCNFNDARRFMTKFIDRRCSLPTAGHLKFIAAHLKEINKVIRDNDGFELLEDWYWTCIGGCYNPCTNWAQSVNLRDGNDHRIKGSGLACICTIFDVPEGITYKEEGKKN